MPEKDPDDSVVTFLTLVVALAADQVPTVFSPEATTMETGDRSVRFTPKGETIWSTCIPAYIRRRDSISAV